MPDASAVQVPGTVQTVDQFGLSKFEQSEAVPMYDGVQNEQCRRVLSSSACNFACAYKLADRSKEHPEKGMLYLTVLHRSHKASSCRLLEAGEGGGSAPKAVAPCGA